MYAEGRPGQAHLRGIRVGMGFCFAGSDVSTFLPLSIPKPAIAWQAGGGTEIAEGLNLGLAVLEQRRHRNQAPGSDQSLASETTLLLRNLV